MPDVKRPDRKTRPNIVYLFSDEHRWCSCPFTERPDLPTPHMSKLAGQGVRMDNCCSTSPICVPYRGMMITGQWPHQSSCVSNEVFLDHRIIGQTSPTIAHAFKDAGYTTGYIGKWHLHNDSAQYAGFDEFSHWLYGDNHWETEVRDIPSGEEFKTVTGYNATGMTDQALDFLGRHAQDEDPFLLMVSINPPHWRWDDAPEEMLEKIPEGEDLYYRPNVNRERYRKRPQEVLYYRNYLAHICAVDREVGRVMDFLDEKGLSEDTVFIYSSDHGSSFWSNDATSKANPFDESVRVPFIARWPGRIEAGRICKRNMGTMDLFPTLCGLANIPVPESCGGTNLAPTLLSQPQKVPETQLLTVNSFRRNYYKRRLGVDAGNSFVPCRGVRSERYSYVVNEDGPWLLYDNIADPYQMNNLIADPAHQSTREHLHQELIGWLAKAEDPFVPDELKPEDVAERIRVQNQTYSLKLHEQDWQDYRQMLIAELKSSELTPEQTAALPAAVEKVTDGDNFGFYLTCDQELNGKRKWTDLPKEEIQKRLDAHLTETKSAIEAELNV